MKVRPQNKIKLTLMWWVIFCWHRWLGSNSLFNLTFFFYFTNSQTQMCWYTFWFSRRLMYTMPLSRNVLRFANGQSKADPTHTLNCYKLNVFISKFLISLKHSFFHFMFYPFAIRTFSLSVSLRYLLSTTGSGGHYWRCWGRWRILLLWTWPYSSCAFI